jgi:3',5'-nucleoside bisphosphate phosphatase
VYIKFKKLVRITINMELYDLHNHTIASKDGATPGRDLIDLAVDSGMKGIGICDHDVFPDESLYDYAKGKGIKLALGIEFSCYEAHIIGYNMTLKGEDKKFLEDRFAKLETDYVNNTKIVIGSLQKKGFDITYDKVLDLYNRDKASKLWVMKYLVDKIGAFQSWADARKYLRMEKISVADGYGIEKLHPGDAIDLIHRAGGHAIWAHPFITTQRLREWYFDDFKKHNIDAIEAGYAYNENGYSGTESNYEIDQIVRSKLKKLGIAISGGSDSHFPLKTYSDLSPIRPGDFGINQEEFEKISFMFR